MPGKSARATKLSSVKVTNFLQYTQWESIELSSLDDISIYQKSCREKRKQVVLCCSPLTLLNESFGNMKRDKV